MKLTFSVRSVIRLDKKKHDGTCPIYFSVRVGPYTTRIPSGKYLFPKDWDAKNNCPKKSNKTLQLLASFLSRKESDFERYMLTQENLGKSITLMIATQFFKQDTHVTLFSFWEEQIRLWEHTKEHNTLKSYRSALNVVKKFNNKLNFGDLTYDCIQKFDLYMANTRNNAIGGRYTKHKCLRAIINQAIMKGFMNETPYRFFKVKAAVGNRKFLSIEEVKQLMNFKLPEEERMLIKVRDLFLFSCFTGLRFSDVMNLKFAEVKENPDRLEFIVKKTDKPLTIPLNSNALSIINKFGKLSLKHPNKSVFPNIANQTINRELKTLMERVGISKEISFHCARHTFASNHVEARTSIVHLKDLLGHSKLDQTQIYAKSLQSDLFESISKLDKMYYHCG